MPNHSHPVKSGVLRTGWRRRYREPASGRISYGVGLIVSFFLFASCAQIATVKTINPSLAGADKSTEHRLRNAGKLPDALQALGEYLTLAQGAINELRSDPDNRKTRDLYNFAVARAVETIEDAELNPWAHPLEVPSSQGVYRLTGKVHPGPDRNPAAYEIIPTDRLIIGGTFLTRRVRLEGIGAPVVAIGREEKKDFRNTFTSRRLYGNATALIYFQGHDAEIEFFLPFATERVPFGGRDYPLAADFTAAAAVGLAREHPEKLGLTRMLHPEKYADTARLMRLQVYDPNRIPVIFVHGLQDTPTSWVPMINALYEDPAIRRRYQFWVFSYPSGYPYPYSAALLRKELDAVNKAFPDHKKYILIGHSMGGIISRLMITDAGDQIWRDYFGKSPAETNIAGSARKLLEESLIFNHRTDVSRVVFICAPHRGAPMGANLIGRIGTKLIRMPLMVATVPLRAIQAASIPPDSASAQLNRIPTSIDTLSPSNRFVREINKFPTTPGIPFHTIEGDRGRGDAPNSSDGVVPYWSSHLHGAISELIVPSNHSAPRNPQAIAEVERILKEAAPRKDSAARSPTAE